MPPLHRVGAVAIRVFLQDHEPPHVHLLGPGFGLRLILGSWEEQAVFGKPRGHEATVALPPSPDGGRFADGSAACCGRWVKANEAAVRAAWQRTRPRR